MSPKTETAALLLASVLLSGCVGTPSLDDFWPTAPARTILEDTGGKGFGEGTKIVVLERMSDHARRVRSVAAGSGKDGERLGWASKAESEIAHFQSQPEDWKEIMRWWKKGDPAYERSGREVRERLGRALAGADVVNMSLHLVGPNTEERHTAWNLPWAKDLLKDHLKGKGVSEEKADEMALELASVVGKGNKVKQDALHVLILEAADAGTVFTLAAGNDGKDTPHLYPAAALVESGKLHNLLVVAALGRSGQGLARGGDWGWATGTNDCRAAPQDIRKRCIAAPGTRILVTNGGEAQYRVGTSLAAPAVAGALASVKAAYPDVPGTVVAERLLQTGEQKVGGHTPKLNAVGAMQQYGWEVAERAVKADGWRKRVAQIERRKLTLDDAPAGVRRILKGAGRLQTEHARQKAAGGALGA